MLGYQVRCIRCLVWHTFSFRLGASVKRSSPHVFLLEHEGDGGTTKVPRTVLNYVKVRGATNFAVAILNKLRGRQEGTAICCFAGSDTV